MKNKRTPEEWKKEINRYQKSGLSFNKYCKDNGISPSTLLHWKKKYLPSPAKEPNKLIKISSPLNNERKMKLSFNRVTIEFPTDLPVEKITHLVTALKEV